MKANCISKIGSCLIALFFVLNFYCVGFAAPSATKETSRDKPTLLKGSVNQLLLLCSYAGITLDKNELPGKITAVKLGTSAAYFGLAENDRVLAATLENNQLSLRIDRNGKKFFLRLPISASALRSATNAFAGRNMSELKIKLEAPSEERFKENFFLIPKDTPEQKEAFKDFCSKYSTNLPKAKLPSELKDIRALQDYDMVLIVDRSGSMSMGISGDENSPKSNNSSKWRWVQSQVIRASNEFANAFKRGVKLIMFDLGYDVYQNCAPGELFNIFLATKTGGGTNLTPPLREVLKTKIALGKPLIICVCTDGMRIGNYDDLTECIAEATKAIPGQYDLAIHFLIVNAKEPDKEITTLKSDVMKAGAKFDVVHVKSFQEIEQRGLINTLVDIATAK